MENGDYYWRQKFQLLNSTHKSNLLQKSFEASLRLSSLLFNDGVLKFSTWKTKKMLVVCSVIQIHRQSGLCNWGSRFVSQKGGNFKIIFSIPYLIIYKPELRETQGMWSPPHANIFHWHHLSLKTCVCSKFVKLVARLTNSYHSVQKNANANITNVFPTFINFKEILCLLGMLNSSDIRILAFPSMRIIKKIVMEKMCHWLDMVFQRYFLTKAAYVLSISKAITHSKSCLGQDHFTLILILFIKFVKVFTLIKKITTCTFCSIAICGIVLPILVGM